MKKLTFILALGVALTLTACGSGSAATETTDSIVDSASVGVTDSTTAQIPTVEPVTGGEVNTEIPQK